MAQWVTILKQCWRRRIRHLPTHSIRSLIKVYTTLHLSRLKTRLDRTNLASCLCSWSAKNSPGLDVRHPRMRSNLVYRLFRAPHFFKNASLQSSAFPVSLLLVGFSFLLVVETATAQTCTGTPNTGTLLPQDHCYQWHLYDWLETLEIEDVDLPRGTISWDGYYADEKDLSRLYLTTGHWFDDRPTFVITGEPRWFVLGKNSGAGIEGAGYVPDLNWSNQAAQWHDTDLTLSGGGQGNPYFENPAICRRALVSAAVDMMMQDKQHVDRENNRSDFLGGQLTAWGYSYNECKHLLDPDTRRWGFEEGFSRMLDKLNAWGPVHVNTNMDTRAVSAIAYVYMGTDDEAVRQKAIRTARMFLFGSETGTFENLDNNDAIFRKAGYVGEAQGPETTYNGVSFNHLLEAYAVVEGDPAWSFMEPVVEKFIEFFVYQYFVDPDDYIDGPGGYSARTGGSFANDQQSFVWKYIAAATMHPTEKGLARKKLSTSLEYPVFGAMSWQEWTRNAVKWYDDQDFGTQSADAPGAWKHDHWPTATPYYPIDPNWATSLRSLVADNDTRTQLPWRRDASFNKLFGDEFWAYKSTDGRTDFGWWVEHVPRKWKYDSWAGGSLQTFWTEATGMLVMSKHNKSGDEWSPSTPWDHEDSRVFSVINGWPAHHVWGYDDSSQAFTNAAWNDVGAASVDATQVESGRPYVEITAGFADQRGWPDGVVDPAGAGYDLSRFSLASRFAAIDNGIEIHRSVSTDGTISAKEMWETIPIYLRDGEQSESSETIISYWSGSGWAPLGTSIVRTTKLRLTRRFDGVARDAYIIFGEERGLKAGPVWEGLYQTQNILQPVHIDLHGQPGTTKTLPATTEIQYRIVTTDPDDTSSSNIPPSASFNWSATDLTVQFTSDSFDPDGNVTSWSWEFGDGQSSSSEHPQHSYAAGGAYNASLTVTDNEGASSTASKSISVSASSSGNSAPTANFNVSVTGLDASFSDQSADADGAIVSWQWTFGDGATSSAQNPQHMFESAGTYEVVLSVSDDDGATDTETRQLSVAPATTADLQAVARTIAIDGDPAEWTGIPTRAISDVSPSGSSPSASDLSGTFGLSWNENFLYVLVRVEDDEYDVDGDPALWKLDGVEVMVDGFNDKQNEYGSDDHQIAVRADGTVIDADGYSGAADAIAAGMPTASGYVLEIAVAWNFIKGSTPQTGQLYGFNVALNDRDNEEWQSQLQWTYGPQHWRNTSGWGEFALASDAQTTVYQSITLEPGWNIVSSFVRPTDLSIETIFADIADRIRTVETGDGLIYSPDSGVNEIGTWDPTAAYSIFATEPVVLTIAGEALMPSTTSISVQSGWNLVPYIPTEVMAIGDALATLEGNLVLLKDYAGRVYYPEYGIDEVGTLRPGHGYKIFVDQSATFTFPDSHVTSKSGNVQELPSVESGGGT